MFQDRRSKRAKIVKLVKSPVPNLPAFLNSCEDYLRGDPGVFDYLIKNKIPERPSVALERISATRARFTETTGSSGSRTRASASAAASVEAVFASADPMLSTYFANELTRATKLYDEWVKDCLEFLEFLVSGHYMEDALLVKLKTHASFKTWTEVPLGTQPNRNLLGARRSRSR